MECSILLFGIELITKLGDILKIFYANLCVDSTLFFSSYFKVLLLTILRAYTFIKRDIEKEGIWTHAKCLPTFGIPIKFLCLGESIQIIWWSFAKKKKRKKKISVTKLTVMDVSMQKASQRIQIYAPKTIANYDGNTEMIRHFHSILEFKASLVCLFVWISANLQQLVSVFCGDFE